MKRLFFLLLAFAATRYAHTQVSSATINVSGTRIKQIKVDGSFYTISNTGATDEKMVLVSGLSEGEHSLEIYRSNQFGAGTVTIRKTFTTRSGYDLTIDIANDGSVNMTETRNRNRVNAGAEKPMGTAAFNKLYSATRAKTSSVARSTLLETELANKRVTSKQASTLIQLVNTESLRLKLAKQAYTRVTDPQNYSTVIKLLNSATNRNELNSYIASLPAEDDDGDGIGQAISNEEFLSIRSEVAAETSSSDRNYYLSNFFSNQLYLYSSAQARELIQLVASQSDRLALSKKAYRGVTDRANYYLVSQLLTSSYDRSDLQAYINSYEAANPLTAVTIAVFDDLYRQTYNQGTNSARYTHLVNMFTGGSYYFTTAQAKQLIQLVQGESNRLSLAKTSYALLVDKTNYIQLNDLLSLQSSRTDLANFVNGTTSTAAAMTDDEFNKLYREVQYTFGLGAKMSALTDIFNNQTYNFTVVQAKTLIQLVSSESNRLALAKLSYNNLTDPQNVSQLNTILSQQSSRDELAAYVSSYAINN